MYCASLPFPIDDPSNVIAAGIDVEKTWALFFFPAPRTRMETPNRAFSRVACQEIGLSSEGRNRRSDCLWPTPSAFFWLSTFCSPLACSLFSRRPFVGGQGTLDLSSINNARAFLFYFSFK